MSFEKLPINNEILSLEDTLKKIHMLMQKQDNARTNQEFNKLSRQIEILYTENNNELLNYERTLK